MYPAGNDYPSLLFDDGIEAGVSPGPLTVTASLLQGGDRKGESYAGRVAARRSLGALNLALGASLWRNQLLDGSRRAAAVFGYAAVGPLSWVWEGHEKRVPTACAAGCSPTSWPASCGVVGPSGAPTGSRTPIAASPTGRVRPGSAGFDALLTPYVGLQAAWHRQTALAGAAVPDKDVTSGETVLHVDVLNRHGEVPMIRNRVRILELLASAAILGSAVVANAAAFRIATEADSRVTFTSHATLESFSGSTDAVHGDIDADLADLTGDVSVTIPRLNWPRWTPASASGTSTSSPNTWRPTASPSPRSAQTASGRPPRNSSRTGRPHMSSSTANSNCTA